MKTKKRTALVTGAGNGIGIAICNHLENKGYNIIAVSRNQEHLNLIRSSLRQKEHLFLICDLVTPVGCNDLLNFIQENGLPHVVVNNLRTPSIRKKLIGASINVLNSNVKENIDHLLVIMKPVIEFQREEKFGRWIGIGSMSEHFGVPGMAVYNLQKSILESLIKTLATEEGQHGITANMVVPGLISTPAVTENYSEQEFDLRSKQNVMKRIGTVDEVAAAVAFLASEEASYITGITLPVNGGNHLAWNFL
ncbi:MAG: SDR family NAD(P)-dependent oxidoreductase [Chitinophagales bacterium]